MGACSKESRKKIRKTLGTLKQLTVQEKTRTRYKSSLSTFFAYLKEEHITLPTRRDEMDQLVSDYLEYLWAEGEGRATASTFMAALQDHQPKLRHNLPGSWRLMKTWSVHEVPARAPPMTESVLRAMVGWSVLQGYATFGLSLLVGFYGLLRTGELLSLQSWQIHMSSPQQPAVINLGLTKSGKRQGAAESITLTEKHVLQHLWAWKRRVPEHTFLTLKPHAWRNLFTECLRKLKLDKWDFRPYSLRRGGATHLFVKGGSLDKVLLLGRWTALKTAKTYINSGLAMLTDIQVPKTLLAPFHNIFHTWNSKPPLEPVLKENRAGERGKKRNKAQAKREGDCFLVVCWETLWFFKYDCLHSEPESSTGWREAQGMPGIFLSPRVAGGEKIVPVKVGGMTFLDNPNKFVSVPWNLI